MPRSLLGPLITIFLCNQINAQGRGVDLPAYYDASSGNLTINTTNVHEGTFLGYVLDALGDGEFRSENHTPIMNAPGFVTANNNKVGEANFDGVDGGVYSLGEILPPGLSFEELRDTYFGVDVFGRPGIPSNREVNYYVTGPAGSGIHHLLSPIFSPSPHVPINDETMGPTSVDRWATEVSLRYNLLDGTLAIDSTGENGGAIISYSIQLTSPSFDIESFQPIGTLQPVATADNIAEVVFTGIDEGIHSLGPILPTGLTTEEVSALFDTLLFIGEPNHSVDALDVNVSGAAMSLLVVPEPGGGPTLLFASLLILAANSRLSAAAKRCAEDNG